MNKNKKGIIYIIFAALSFSLMTFFVKSAGDVPVMQKAFFRNLPGVLIACVMIAKTEEGFGSFKLVKNNLFPYLMRCIMGCVGIYTNFWAIDHMGLPDSNILNKMSPVFAMILSIWILREKPNKFEWFTVFMAFGGAIFIIKPTLGIASLPALVGLASGFAAGMAYTFVRKLGKNGVHSAVIVFGFSVSSCVMALPYMIFNYHPISLVQFGILMCAGIFGSLGQLCITAAYKAAPAKEISVFDYTQVLFAALWGVLLLHEVPDILSVVGYVIIIGTAVARWVYTNRRDRKLNL